jgi:hypothetical protein
MSRRLYHTGHWITAKRAGSCDGCRESISRGFTVQWHPSTQTLLCRRCGLRYDARAVERDEQRQQAFAAAKRSTPPSDNQ